MYKPWNWDEINNLANLDFIWVKVNSSQKGQIFWRDRNSILPRYENRNTYIEYPSKELKAKKGVYVNKETKLTHYAVVVAP